MWTDHVYTQWIHILTSSITWSWVHAALVLFTQFVMHENTWKSIRIWIFSHTEVSDFWIPLHLYNSKCRPYLYISAIWEELYLQCEQWLFSLSLSLLFNSSAHSCSLRLVLIESRTPMNWPAHSRFHWWGRFMCVIDENIRGYSHRMCFSFPLLYFSMILFFIKMHMLDCCARVFCETSRTRYVVHPKSHTVWEGTTFESEPNSPLLKKCVRYLVWIWAMKSEHTVSTIDM